MKTTNVTEYYALYSAKISQWCICYHELFFNGYCMILVSMCNVNIDCIYCISTLFCTILNTKKGHALKIRNRHYICYFKI